jgi:spore coat polysaccharide biosynthesis predicted glycosyltransferase SpsG
MSPIIAKSQKAKVVLIRADGSKAIGMGHLNRACLLANMLKERFGLLTKVVMKDDSAAKVFLHQHALEELEVITLPSYISVVQEISMLIGHMEKEKASLLIVDILEQETNPEYLKSVRGYGCPVVAITDDSQRRELDADITVNGNPAQIGQDYSDKAGRYLLGPMYFLMDPIYGRIKVKEPDGNVKKILLTLGGSDHNNLLFRILDALEKKAGQISVLIVTSMATGYLNQLENHLKALSISSELFVDVNTLAPLWGKCDLAVTAGGNTLFERIASRLPGATICQLERQMKIADCFQSLGVNFNLGFGPDLSEETLVNKISEFLSDRELHVMEYQKSPEIIDGQGLNRLADEMKILLKEGVCEL